MQTAWETIYSFVFRTIYYISFLKYITTEALFIIALAAVGTEYSVVKHTQSDFAYSNPHIHLLVAHCKLCKDP